MPNFLANDDLSLLPPRIALNIFACVLVYDVAFTALPWVKLANSFLLNKGPLADVLSYLSNKVLLYSFPPPGILSKPIPSAKLIVGFSEAILFITALFKSDLEKGSPNESNLLYSFLNRSS